MAPEYLVLGESYTAAKQVNVDTRDGLDIFFAVVDFDVNQPVFGIVRRATAACSACSLSLALS